MTTFYDAIQNAVKSAACTILDPPANAIDLAKKAFGSGSGSPPFNGPRFLQNYFCNKPPSKQFDPPFTGGQCPVKYTCPWTSTDKPIDDVVRNNSGTLNVWGPVSGPYSATDPGYTTPNRYYATCYGDANGNRTTSPVNINITQSIYATTRKPTFNLTSFTVTRQDGLADNCGDPPVLPIPAPPAGYNITNTNITYNDINNNTYNVPMNIQIGYFQFNIRGELILPVNVTVNNNIKLQPQINLTNNNFQINIPGDNTTGDNPPDSRPDNKPYDVQPDNPAPAPPPDSGQPTPTKPLPPSKGKVMIGVLVTVLPTPPGSIGELYQSGGDPNVWFPDLGLVSFQIAIDSANSGWTSDIRVKNRRCYIPCPAEQGAIGVAGTPRLGVQWVLTPIYSLKEQEITFPG